MARARVREALSGGAGLLDLRRFLLCIVCYQAGVQTLSFTITGPDRKPVTDFAVVHDKPMHMVVARRDLAGYQHLHPTMAPDGTWTVKVDLDKPGPWRAVADFTAS